MNCLRRLLACTSLAAAVSLQASIPITSDTFSYTQDFDSLPAASTGAALDWTNNHTLPGWHQGYSGNPGAQTEWSFQVVPGGSGLVDSGGVGTNTSVRFANIGHAESTDRSVAVFRRWSASGSVGAIFQNHSGMTLRGFAVGYTGEQWRRGGTEQTSLYFEYQVVASVDGLDINSMPDNWTRIDALRFDSPKFDGGVRDLDGKHADHRRVIAPVYIVAPIPEGEFLAIRWHQDLTNTGGEIVSVYHVLGIDDVTLSMIPDPPQWVGPKAPLKTLMWALNRGPVSPERMRQMGVDVVWIHGREDALARASQLLESNGILAQPNYIVQNDQSWLQTHPELTPQRFLSSVPATAPAVGEFRIDLLAGIQGDYSLVTSPGLLRYWKVWDRTTREALPPEAWSYADGHLVLMNAASGHSYNAAFSVVDRTSGVRLDLFRPEARQLVLNRYQNLMQADPATLFRPTQFAVYFTRFETDAGQYRDWYGPGTVLGESFIARHESLHGVPFDADDLFAHGDTRSHNDEPTPGFRRLLDTYRDLAAEFAPQFTANFHQHGRLVRMFWGDSWIGLEPQTPRFPETGYDQIVTSIGSPQDIRRIMTVSPQLLRAVRFYFWNLVVGEGKPRFDADWRSFLRAALREMPEGISLGGPPLSTLLDEEPGFQALVTKRFAEFDSLHAWIGGEKAYTHELRIGIANAWGSTRAWPREFTVNHSQHLWRALTDLPLAVEWLSLDEIATNPALLETLDLLIAAGEPGSSWGGGDAWAQGAKAVVQDWVAQGGAFLAVDGAGVGESGPFHLADLLGLNYRGPAYARSEQRLFNSFDRVRRFIDGFPGVETASLSLAPAFAALLDFPDPLGPVERHAAMEPRSGTSVLSSGEALLTRNDFGQGQAWYLSGLAAGASDDEFFKRLLYHISGKSEQLLELDCPTAGGFVYYYPRKRILIAFNHSALDGVLEVQAGALRREGRVHLVPLRAGTPALQLLADDPLQERFSVSLPPGDLAVWQVHDALDILSIRRISAAELELVFATSFRHREHTVEQSVDLVAANWSPQAGVTISPLGDGIFDSRFPMTTGDQRFYRVVAKPTVLFLADFEDGAPGWTQQGDIWELGTPTTGPGSAYSGANVWATRLHQQIPARSQARLRSPPIDLTGITAATLSFWEYRHLDSSVAHHGTVVNILDEQHNLIAELSRKAGHSGGWQQRSASLSAASLDRVIVLEFHLYSDDLNLRDGWYIDEVSIEQR